MSTYLDFFAAPFDVDSESFAYADGARTRVCPLLDIAGFEKHATGRHAENSVEGWISKELNLDKIIYVVVEVAGESENERSGWLPARVSNIRRSGVSGAYVEYETFHAEDDPSDYLMFGHLFDRAEQAPTLLDRFFVHVSSGDLDRRQ